MKNFEDFMNLCQKNENVTKVWRSSFNNEEFVVVETANDEFVFNEFKIERCFDNCFKYREGVFHFAKNRNDYGFINMCFAHVKNFPFLEEGKKYFYNINRNEKGIYVESISENQEFDIEIFKSNLDKIIQEIKMQREREERYLKAKAQEEEAEKALILKAKALGAIASKVHQDQNYSDGYNGWSFNFIKNQPKNEEEFKVFLSNVGLEVPAEKRCWYNTGVDITQQWRNGSYCWEWHNIYSAYTD